MPLVAHRPLESLQRIQAEGHEVLTIERANRQHIRELHIGLLNMMPDGALRATERQFLRLIGNSNRIAQIYVHLFTVNGVPRSPEMQHYIEEHYEKFDDLKREGLDAIICTGTNPVYPNLSQEPYLHEVKQVFDWADKNVVSVLCSCLASHLALHHFYDIDRVRARKKRFGVYTHRVVDTYHPLLSNLNTRFDMPHSRWNGVSESALREKGLPILVRDDGGEIALACSQDGIRQVFFQGHPEYDKLSLLKEFKRDLSDYLQGKIDYASYLPEHYFSPRGIELIEQFLSSGKEMAYFPEAELEQEIDMTWGDTAKALFANWLGLVYQLTHFDRHQQFMEGIDPSAPLVSLKAIQSQRL
ncbi:MAG: homoserine O-succinyltransferase [Cardiobacteriaceae bacterium]|nr:homoserine O-succinyltransferase [Cardiobacteriaceae bacterium]